MSSNKKITTIYSPNRVPEDISRLNNTKLLQIYKIKINNLKPQNFNKKKRKKHLFKHQVFWSIRINYPNSMH